MNYLTTTELSKIWNISGRMIAYYCENGQIAGVIKKGRTWLIPQDSTKPNSKQIYSCDNIDLYNNIAKVGITAVQNKAETDRLDYVYQSGQIYKNLGITRDTLRNYEKIGLISPKRKSESKYREFDKFDINFLMTIDFYRKRGFSAVEIKALFKASNCQNTSITLGQKIVELEKDIRQKQCMLKRLAETKEIYDTTNKLKREYEFRDFPLYSVLKTFDDELDICNYVEPLGLEGDVLSNRIRAVSFDDNGFLGSKMCIVKKAEQRESDKSYLETGRCICIRSIEPFFDPNYAEEVFVFVQEIMKEHNIQLKGISYIFIKFILCENESGQKIYELWLPIK